MSGAVCSTIETPVQQCTHLLGNSKCHQTLCLTALSYVPDLAVASVGPSLSLFLLTLKPSAAVQLLEQHHQLGKTVATELGLARCLEAADDHRVVFFCQGLSTCLTIRSHSIGSKADL